MPVTESHVITGNVGAAPELKHTPSGVAVATFNVAVQHRRYNDQSKQWEDAADPEWYTVETWRDFAEQTVAVVEKGMRVTVTSGKLRVETYKDKAGEPVARKILVADDIAIPVRTLARRAGGSQGGGAASGSAPASRPSAPSQPAGGAPSGYQDDTPF